MLVLIVVVILLARAVVDVVITIAVLFDDWGWSLR